MTASLLWRRSVQLDTLIASEDAPDVRLVDLTNDQYNRSLSPRSFIDQAIEKYGTLHEMLHYYRDDTRPATIDDGHMEYEKYIVVFPSGQRVFVKQHTPTSDADPDRSERLLSYLQKEYAVYQHLTANGYPHIPDRIEYRDNAIVMHSLDKADDWVWHAPAYETAAYIEAAITATKDLEAIPIPKDINFGVMPSYESHTHDGWGSYTPKTRGHVIKRLRAYTSQVKSEAFSGAASDLINELDRLHEQSSKTIGATPTVMCHHDFRQSNIAFHPSHGVKIVDWSWAGPGLKGSDATTLLIDLHKHGIAVDQYMNEFNKDHALVMLGYWLMRGIAPIHTGSDVRFQQIHSAVAAYMLLRSHDAR